MVQFFAHAVRHSMNPDPSSTARTSSKWKYGMIMTTVCGQSSCGAVTSQKMRNGSLVLGLKRWGDSKCWLKCKVKRKSRSSNKPYVKCERSYLKSPRWIICTYRSKDVAGSTRNHFIVSLGILPYWGTFSRSFLMEYYQLMHNFWNAKWQAFPLLICQECTMR